MEALMGKDIRLEDDDLKFSNNQDFSIVSGYDNLKQSIINRIKTIKGEYYNPFYGSEIDKCYSKPIGQSLKNQMIGYIIEALNQEPRIKNKDKISVEFDSDERLATVNITVTPIDTNVTLNLVFPLFID
jgi:phage baseplate assembly protein W